MLRPGLLCSHARVAVLSPVAFRRRRQDSSRPLARGTRADGMGSGWTNLESGQGSAMDRQKWTGFERGCELDNESTNALMRHNAIARRMARRPAEDANREGHVVKGSVRGQPLNITVGGPPAETDEPPDPFESWAQKFGLHRLMVQADSQALAHGRALWVYGVDDGLPTSEPLDLGSIRRLLWVRVVSRTYATPMAWGADENKPRFELPTHYQVTFLRSGKTAVYHWTRVWAWDGVDISDEERAQSSDAAGGSVFDLAWAALKGYGISQETALEALTRNTQAVWTNTNLARAVDGGKAQDAAQHYERVASGGGQFGDYVLAAGESYSIVGRPPTGIAEILERFEMALVASSEMSEPVLMGTQLSISGLNSDSDGLVRSWYDTLASGAQPERFTPALLFLYRIASRALNGPTGGVPILDLQVGWKRLWQLTEKEAAEVRKLNSDSRSVDLGARVISVGEARSDQTLIDEYELAPDAVVDLEGTEDDAPAIEDIEIADADIMPPGERPLTLLEARDIIGVRSNGGVLSFINRTNTPLFRPGASYRVFESHIRAAMRESQVI